MQGILYRYPNISAASYSKSIPAKEIQGQAGIKVQLSQAAGFATSIRYSNWRTAFTKSKSSLSKGHFRDSVALIFIQLAQLKAVTKRSAIHSLGMIVCTEVDGSESRD